MQLKISSLFIFYVLAFGSQCQVTMTESELRNATVLEKILDGEYDETLNLTKWKPYPGEEKLMWGEVFQNGIGTTLLNEDRYCFSKLDTVMEYNDNYGKHAIVLYYTMYVDLPFLHTYKNLFLSWVYEWFLERDKRQIQEVIVQDGMYVELGMARFDFIDDEWMHKLNNRTVNEVVYPFSKEIVQVSKGENSDQTKFAISISQKSISMIQDGGDVMTLEEYCYFMDDHNFSDLYFSYTKESDVYCSGGVSNTSGGVMSDRKIRFIDNNSESGWYDIELVKNEMTSFDGREVNKRTVKVYTFEELFPRYPENELHLGTIRTY